LSAGATKDIFWDVEIFMLRFICIPRPTSRSLLTYRYHADGARRRARGWNTRCLLRMGIDRNREDTTPRSILLKSKGLTIPIYTGTQIHVTADVAYAIWRYWKRRATVASCETSASRFLQTARFWASRCVLMAARCTYGRWSARRISHSVDDNAYTNWMAVFNLERAAWAAQWMEREDSRGWHALRERCAIAPEEAAHWSDTAARLYRPAPDHHGVIEQFAGFFDLEAYPLERGDRFKAPVSRLFDWEKINRLRLVKQADVLMLLHLLPDAFTNEVVAANYRYYEPITDHGSSLSPPIHAAIAARLGLRDDAERYWRQSLWLDLSNTMGNSLLGVHPACMGGTWQALMYGFLGLRCTDHGPKVDDAAAARLPAGWREVSLAFACRGRTYPIIVSRDGNEHDALQSILVPLDGSGRCARVRCGMGLATRFNAKVHVLSASPKPAPAQEALDRLRVAEEYRSLIVLHQAASYPADAILSALKAYSVELLIMSARGEASETTADTGEIAGHVTRAVIEASPVPVLLLPSHYRERLPWRSAMVPLSGEPAGDEALALAVRLANELGLRIDIVHVSDDAGSDPLRSRNMPTPHHGSRPPCRNGASSAAAIHERAMRLHTRCRSHRGG
jgi:nucleotide-binding universal stress UspA family protein